MPDRSDSLPLVRIWGRNPEADWNEYWRMGRVLHMSRELAEVLQLWGAREIDIRPKRIPSDLLISPGDFRWAMKTE